MHGHPARTRVAPSPTGDPHVGTAYQALFNKAVAEVTGGQFLLRIEDTDRERYHEGSEEMIFRALRWLHLDWDEGPDVGGPKGPYRQSERTEIYREHAAILLEKGTAYRCFCTPERLQALREEQQAAKQSTRYDGRCKSISKEDSDARARSETHVVRLVVPRGGETIARDACRGEIRFAHAEIDDQILMKSDGFPTYHLANVVDDKLMEITHVIRGEEWLPSLPKHLLLYRAFDWQPPTFVHTPLLRNADKSKLSKRKNPVSLDLYRSDGYLPEAIVNFLGTLGWSHPDGKDFFSYREFVERFDWERLSLAGPIFDLDKLVHLNGLWLRSLSVEQLRERILAGGFTVHGDEDESLLEAAVELTQERLEKLSDFDDAVSFFFEAPALSEGSALMGKKYKGGPAEIKDALLALKDRLPPEAEWTTVEMEAALRAVAGDSELKPRDVFFAARVAVTGRPVSTPLFETLTALGREEVARRLDTALALL
jgi:glutamyl-tRNA synthetase